MYDSTSSEHTFEKAERKQTAGVGIRAALHPLREPHSVYSLVARDLAILNRESGDSESCDSKVTLSIDRMRIGWRFQIDFPRFYFTVVRLIFCFALQNRCLIHACNSVRKVRMSITFLSANFGFTPPSAKEAQNEKNLHKSVENPQN